MSDLFLPPTKEKIQRLMRLAEDPICFWAMATGITALDSLDKEVTTTAQDFYRLSRLMLLNYPVEAVNMFCLAIEDVSNEQWSNFKIPDLKSKSDFKIDPLNKNISILQVANDYGLIVKKNKSLCPFHKDQDPSLTFYPKTNSFYCFGCRLGGDIITFVQKMEVLKNGK